MSTEVTGQRLLLKRRLAGAVPRRVHGVAGAPRQATIVVQHAEQAARSYSSPAGIAPRPFVIGHCWLCVRYHVKNRRGIRLGAEYLSATRLCASRSVHAAES